MPNYDTEALRSRGYGSSHARCWYVFSLLRNVDSHKAHVRNIGPYLTKTEQRSRGRNKNGLQPTLRSDRSEESKLLESGWNWNRGQPPCGWRFQQSSYVS